MHQQILDLLQQADMGLGPLVAEVALWVQQPTPAPTCEQRRQAILAARRLEDWVRRARVLLEDDFTQAGCGALPVSGPVEL